MIDKILCLIISVCALSSLLSLDVDFARAGPVTLLLQQHIIFLESHKCFGRTTHFIVLFCYLLFERTVMFLYVLILVFVHFAHS